MSDAHPHALRSGEVAVRLDPARLRALSRLDPARALGAVAAEWTVIALAIALATAVHHPLVTLLAIVVIGARQHALLIIAHDASHFRFLPDRRWNDLLGNLFLSWPTFVSVQGFRHFHGSHHRFLAAEGDGNRELWGTHDARGALTAEWRYPRSPAGLALKVLRRAAFLTGGWWLLRGLVGGFAYDMSTFDRALRAAWMLAVAALITAAHAWWGFFVFWVVPYCTVHVAVQYVRLICEHSNLAADGPYTLTRTTVPTALERWLILPRNVGYHLEHHWYPSVPFYRLDALHEALCEDPGFREHARISPSVLASLRDVTRGHA